MPIYKYREKERDLIDDETGEVLATEPLQPQYGIGAKKIADAMKKTMPLFKTPWNHDTNAASDQSATVTPEVTRTQLNQQKDADINTIVQNFLKTGELKTVPMPPQFSDLEELDFQEAMDQVNAAQRSFEALPARIRNAFQGDPVKFVAYVDHCIERGDVDPLKELQLVDLKVEEPAFEDRLAAAIKKAQEPTAPLGGSPAPTAGKEASKAS